MSTTKRPGARYEICRQCRKEWNVSKQTVIPRSGYLCPVCWGKQRNTESKKGARK